MPVARKLVTIMLAAALCGPVPGAAATARGPEDSAQPSQYLGAVTLITGDHVSVRRVGGRLVPTVQPGVGREHIHFATAGTGDELSIVPSDAWRPLNAGRLDRRLFDVAALLRDGYGDAGRSDLPLIVRPGGPAALTAAGATVTHTLSSVDASAVRQPKESTADFWAAHRDAGRIWLDGLRTPTLDGSVAQIGAPTAWRAGYTGRDVTVAVLDSGADSTHPDLRDRIAGFRNFLTGTDDRDTAGHGTHVASTIAGTGRVSGGRYAGVAPDARLLIGKVCQGGCPESAILAGMEWAATSGARVVNLSLGGPDTAADDPLELAIDRLSAEHGTLFVVAAGNDGGYGAETVSSPASADAALAVGAVDKQDAMAGFSGRGPRVHDAALKPEIVAPGVEITAARSRFSALGKKGDRYVALSGTSMATPHVAGAAAILAQQHPDWTGQQLKAALMASARPLDGTGSYAQGAGRVDVARATAQTVRTEPATVSIGRMAWPHEDDQPVTRTVTYHNPGGAPATLALALTGTGPDGDPVPDGMFRLSASSVTVPAGGQSTVDMTVNTAIPAAEGTFGAHIQATDGTGLRVSTPVAVDREPESYDLTLRPVDGAGRPTDLHFTFVWGVDRLRYRPVPGIGGAGTLRVRRGTYHVDATVATARTDGLFNSSKVAYPAVEVGADTTLAVDARQARPVSVTFDRPGVTPRAVAAGYSRFRDHGALATGVLGDTFDRILIGHVGDPLPREELVADVGGMWAVPDALGDTTRSTVTYNLQWFDYGRMPDGLARHVADAGLAQVRSRYREQSDRKRATKVWIVREPEVGVSVGFGIPFPLPLDRTEFHNADGLQWSAEFQQWTFVKRLVHTETIVAGGVVDHEPGQTYTEDWNSAVFGPGFTRADEWASRGGDQFLLNIPMYSDSGLDRAGQSELDSGSTVLYREGVRIGETDRPGFGQFDVAPELSTYRLETTANRGRTGVSDFSTRISCVWTFTSVRPPDPETAGKDKEGSALPLLVVRFAPVNLTRYNELVATTARIPVTVQRQAGSPEATITSLSVDVSFDDGRTWRPADVTRAPDEPTATARLTHPDGSHFVSLRARAGDSAGNTVEQTVIRAYQAISI